MSWGHYHGSFLAAIALALSDHVGRVYVPSSHDVGSLFPWGSHPLVDHHFSTERCSIVHDRVNVTRLDKTVAVAGYADILAELRVCWLPTSNCGRCSKCLRTLLALQVVGSPAPSFDRGPLTCAEIERIDVGPAEAVPFFREIANYLEAREQAPDIREAIEAAMSRKHYRTLLRRIRLRAEGGPGAVASSVRGRYRRWRRRRQRFRMARR